jgi:hypothetical protein
MNLGNEHAFINSPAKFNIQSPVLKKKADGVITIYNLENDFDLSEEDSKAEKKEKIYDALSHDPDGYLLWIPKEYSEQFLKFVPVFLLEQFKQGNLNFDNGGVGETFLFHYLENGTLVELIDPECFSEVFMKCINQFSKQENIELDRNKNATVNDFFYVESCHLFTHVQDFNNFKNGSVMLELIKSNNIDYYITEHE